MRINSQSVSLVCVFMIVLYPCVLWPAVTGAVNGQVKDAKTGQPLEGVKITLVSARTETLSFILTADKKGHFYKGGLIPGVYKLTLEKDGYLPQEGTIRIQLELTTELDFRLEPSETPGSGEAAGPKSLSTGAEMISAGRYEEAIAFFAGAIAQTPLNPVFHFYKGLAEERKGDGDAALGDYQKAAELKPDFQLPLSRSGLIWAKRNDFDRAAEFYKKALDAGDEDPTTRYNYGVCLMNLGKGEEARAVFEQLLTQDPEYADVYYQLGIISLSAGDSARAKELLEKFILKDPENKNAALAKEILKSLN